jgi:Protein of unknown function (DUF1657)
MTVISNVKQCIATLKGIEAQLSILALQSQDESAQKVFHLVKSHSIERARLVLKSGGYSFSNI